MKIIEAYESVDGTVFTDEAKAKKHDLDCIGEEFDALLLIAVQATNGSVTRNDQFRMCLKLLESRDKARPIVALLHKYLCSLEE